jgi:regulator of sirC expression with transglutaminase-like and TPR domain
MRLAVVVAMLASLITMARAQEPDDENARPPQPTVQSVADRARRSLAVFQVADRDGQTRGVGTGFAVSADGLIATNLHVIGEGRSFSVELADGRKPRVIAVHAADRHLDLAVVRVDVADAPLEPLRLGTNSTLQVGDPLVVLGNPFGLKHSVVSGVLSARREMDGRNMLQLAIPIEPGNSGGPVLDMQGAVHGIVTMKSALTDNLGFAIDAQLLQPLLEKPNPVQIERWVTIGALDRRRWQPLFGANWRQRGGRISVEGLGDGFGGRSLCLFQTDPPAMPYELGVLVKLDDEAGAAGLVFQADGGDKHYGFYPSNGRMRLSCFQGPSVFEWQVLHEQPSVHYKPGDWNHLRVRVDNDRIVCYVNGQEVFESNDTTFRSGKVGLAKFRETRADFRQFQLAAEVSAPTLDPSEKERILRLIEGLPPLAEQTPESLEPLAALAPFSDELLRNRAQELEEQASQLRRAAADVHVQRVAAELGQVMNAEPIDLLQAALLIARLDEAELDVAAYREEVERMAAEIRGRFAEDAEHAERIAALDHYLFEEYGFHGSRHEYYHRANSHLDRVIDDREGLPITLSILYLELGRRLGLELEGVGLPGHFVVRLQKADGESELIDVFDGGRRLSREDAAQLVLQNTNAELSEDDLRATSPPEILQRMLRNLLNAAERDGDAEASHRYLEVLVTIAPQEYTYRGMRAITRYQSGRRTAAVADLDWFLEHEPEGVDLDRVREMREYFLNAIDAANDRNQ